MSNLSVTYIMARKGFLSRDDDGVHTREEHVNQYATGTSSWHLIILKDMEIIIKRKFKHIVGNPRSSSIHRCDSFLLLMMSGEYSSERDQLWVTDDGFSSDGQQFHTYLRDLISVSLKTIAYH